MTSKQVQDLINSANTNANPTVATSARQTALVLIRNIAQFQENNRTNEQAIADFRKQLADLPYEVVSVESILGKTV